MLAFIFQLIFGIVRTINVQHIAKDNLLASVLSGTGVAILWVLSTRAGIDAFNADNPWGIVGYIAGAALSVFIAMRHKQIVTTCKRWIVSSKIKSSVVVLTTHKFVPGEWQSNYTLSYNGFTKTYTSLLVPNEEAAIDVFIQEYLIHKNL